MTAHAAPKFVWLLFAACLALLPRTARADTGEGRTIADIKVIGLKNFTATEVESQMRMKRGTAFSNAVAAKDAEALLKTGWVASNIRIHAEPRKDDAVTVVVTVQELLGVVQEVKFVGDQHMTDDELKKLISVRKGMPMNPIANKTGAAAILRKYQEDGRRYATVKLVEGDKVTDARVVYEISEGPKVKIRSIALNYVTTESGETSKGRLRTQLASSTSWLGIIGGAYDPVKVEFDVNRLRGYYEQLGFLGAAIKPEAVPNADGSEVDVIFYIDEGPRYQVADVRTHGNKVFTEEALLRLTDTRPNQPYKKADIDADVLRLKTYYGYSGRQVPVEPQLTEISPGVVSVSYQIGETDVKRVGEVKIIGNEYTRENVIRREIGLLPGQTFTFPDLLIAQNNLSRLGIFDEDPQTGVRPTVEIENPEVDEPIKNVLVRVKEKPTGSILLGLGVNSDTGLNGSLVLNERNFDITNVPTSVEELLSGHALRGAGQELRLEAVPGSEFQRYSATFRDPRLFDSLYSLSVSAFYFDRGFLEYDESRAGVRTTLGRRISDNWSANYAFRAEHVGVRNVSQFAPESIRRDEGFSDIYGNRVGLVYDTRDNFIRPSHGTVFDVGFEQVVGDYSFPAATAELTKYWTTYSRPDGSGRHVLAARSAVSVVGGGAPVYERLYGGGFRSIRGFSFRGVGPIENDFNVGGKFSWMNSLEYQIPLTSNDQLFAVGFIDSGTVESSVALRDYRVTVGAGLRIALPQLLGPVPIALDFGIPIRQGPNDKKQAFSFYVGFFNL